MTNEIDLLGEQDEPVPHGFVVDTMDKADWALRTMGRAQAEIDRIETTAAALKARIDERLELVTKGQRNTIAAMEAFLRPWADVEVAKANGKRSVKLLSGTVGYRQSPASLDVQDEIAAVAWLKANGHTDMVRVKEEVQKAPVKKLIETAGELPDGVMLRPGAQHFYAEPVVPALESK